MRLKLGLLLSVFSMLLAITSCTKDKLPEPTPENSDEASIWTGPTLVFEKAPDLDPTLEENQDRITENVWITRGTDGGQIYNIKIEPEFDKDTSPQGTRWAIGTIDEIENLEFKPFRAAVDKPKDVVGKDLVMYLVEDNIYLSVKFTSWGVEMDGSFAYERSTPQ